MQSLQTILLVVQVLIAISLIGLILIQHGKGADAGAAFGSGASSTVFGSRGSGNFLTRATSILAFLFLANSLTLAYIASHRMSTTQDSLMFGTDVVIEQQQQPQQQGEMQIPTDKMDMADIVGGDEIPAAPGSANAEIPALPADEVPALPDQ